MAITKYVNHFHNIAVLAAAGTSIEMENLWKTRSELWNECINEISDLASLFQCNDDSMLEKSER